MEINERPHRDIPKRDYFALHSGRSGSESDGEVQDLSDNRFKPIDNPEVFVAETPLNTPTVPETQTSTMSLQDEMNEATLAKEKERLDKEEIELAARAKALSEQMKLEARERQVSLLRNKIEKLQEAWKKANESTQI